jgi:hypothetical protein
MANFSDVVGFDGVSLTHLAVSGMGSAAAVGNFGYSITNYIRAHSLSATEATAANIAKVLATLIVELKQKGVIGGTFS